MTSLGRSPVDPFNQNSNSRDEVLSRKLKFESTFQDDTSQGGANNVKRFNLGEWILKRGERAQRAEQRVQENPFDTESWDHLAKEAHVSKFCLFLITQTDYQGYISPRNVFLLMQPLS